VPVGDKLVHDQKITGGVNCWNWLVTFSLSVKKMRYAYVFLLEVGTEELPASFVDDEQWRSRIPSSLKRTPHNRGN